MRKDGWRRDGDPFISISRGKHPKCSTHAELPRGSFQLTFLETTDTFTFVHVVGLCIRLTFVISHSHDPLVICGGGWHDGGVTGQKAAKPAAAVGGFASTRVNVQKLNIFKETSGQSPAVFLETALTLNSIVVP